MFIVGNSSALLRFRMGIISPKFDFKANFLLRKVAIQMYCEQCLG